MCDEINKSVVMVSEFGNEAAITIEKANFSWGFNEKNI
jgi:hypothetical protein